MDEKRHVMLLLDTAASLTTARDTALANATNSSRRLRQRHRSGLTSIAHRQLAGEIQGRWEGE
jgi:hypothetical protein